MLLRGSSRTYLTVRVNAKEVSQCSSFFMSKVDKVKEVLGEISISPFNGINFLSLDVHNSPVGMSAPNGSSNTTHLHAL